MEVEGDLDWDGVAEVLQAPEDGMTDALMEVAEARQMRSVP